MGGGIKLAKEPRYISTKQYINRLKKIRRRRRRDRKNQNVKRQKDIKLIDLKIHKEGGLVGGRARNFIQCGVILGVECQTKRRKNWENNMFLLKMRK